MKEKGPRKKKQWSRSRNDSLLSCSGPRSSPAKEKKQSKNTPYRSGVVPFLPEGEGKISVLLVTPRKGGSWIFPKGNIARGMDSFHSALKEACEEAGVLGKARKVLLGIAESPKHEFIEYYPLEITEILPEWKESAVRSRLFFSPEEACKELEGREERAVLKVLQQYVREKVFSVG